MRTCRLFRLRRRCAGFGGRLGGGMPFFGGVGELGLFICFLVMDVWCFEDWEGSWMVVWDVWMGMEDVLLLFMDMIDLGLFIIIVYQAHVIPLRRGIAACHSSLLCQLCQPGRTLPQLEEINCICFLGA